VQERVVGLSDAALRRLAATEAAAAKADQSPQSAASGLRAETFWRVQPELETDQATAESPGVEVVPLKPGLVLSLAARRTLNEDDLRVIRMAAAPLIEILRMRGLTDIGPSQPKKGDVR
jgi:hypothetical protein